MIKLRCIRAFPGYLTKGKWYDVEAEFSPPYLYVVEDDSGMSHMFHMANFMEMRR